jgi:hypothetical protein
MATTIDSFVRGLRDRGRAHSVRVERWPRSNHPSLSIVELAVSGRRALAYLKLRNASRGFWGLNPNQLRRIGDSHLPWVVILLHGSDDTGYLLAAQQVQDAVGEAWRAGHDSEFKVNENAVSGLAKAAPVVGLQQRLIDSVTAAV